MNVSINVGAGGNKMSDIKKSFQDINEVTDRHLHIIWTNADPVTSENMVMMYTKNSMLNGFPPVSGILFRPPGSRERKRVFFGNTV